MEKIYENIKRLRLEHGLSQEELAKKTGYTDRSSIAKIESGKVDLTNSKIAEFAKALGEDPGVLMGWKDQKDRTLPSNIITPSAYRVPILGTICAGDGIVIDQSYQGSIITDKRIDADYALFVKDGPMTKKRRGATRSMSSSAFTAHGRKLWRHWPTIIGIRTV